MPFHVLQITFPCTRALSMLHQNTNNNNNNKDGNNNKSSTSLYIIPQKSPSVSVYRASLRATICNLADAFIARFLDPTHQLDPSVDPIVQLAGNLSPVDESPPQLCPHVAGALPPDLNGMYIRNGPNARKVYGGGGHHMFDGDGMLHAVRLRDGKALYCCRHVRTSRFVQEEAAGRSLVPKFFGGINGASGLARLCVFFLRLVLGIVDVTHGWGLANTSVTYFHGKVLAMSEDDMPYVMRVTEDGDLETVGKLQAEPWKMNMCAHPKLDPLTGELIAFSFNPTLPPFSFFSIFPHGLKTPDVPIPLMDLTLVHDFAITQNYVIFPHNQFVVKPLALFFGKLPIVFDKTKVPRLAVIPRNMDTPEEASARVKWFHVPGCNSLHYFNAWEEEDTEEIVIITSVLSPPEFFLEIPADKTCCTMTEIRLHIRTGESSSRKICSGNLEFGTYNLKYTGREMRYIYMCDGNFPRLKGIVKVDLQSGDDNGGCTVVGRRYYDENCYGSEPFFVARGSHEEEEEDYGYLLSLVYNETTSVSELLVMDAQSPSLQIVASVKLPSRVPYGFHGCFIDEAQLLAQEVP